MKIVIEFGYCTDGDFSIMSTSEVEFTREVATEDDYYDYYGLKSFDSKDYDREILCMFDARNYLENLLVDTHISSTHYYIWKYIYNMIEPIIEFVNHMEHGEICKYMSGNYEGTFVKATVLM